ncbi:MAG: hypothetical protein H8E82_01735 [Candidatus Marinimicrobia bacterium]|nr:hypothetical protein [Candidatus Neomarinimicrobiota bacterium]MBL7047516.1 hypothetical protein [Candidatus Neomarinimicrobiota bacterium]
MTIDTQGRPFGSAMMSLKKGEKFYKIYRMTPKVNPGYHFEYRILSKIKEDGSISIAAFNYKVVDGNVEKGDPIVSDNVKPEQLDDLIDSVLKHVNSQVPSELHVIDLTKYQTIEEQLRVLQDLNFVKTQYVD